jgi:hypothetical protein
MKKDGEWDKEQDKLLMNAAENYLEIVRQVTLILSQLAAQHLCA